MISQRRAVRIPWRAPLLDSRQGNGSPAARQLTLVTLLDDDGIAGHGEEAPLPGYGGPGTVSAAEAAGHDIAEWDLRGRRQRIPVWRLLGASEPSPVEANATIGAELPSAAAAEAATAVADGFRTVKLKVGVGDDVARVRAVREAVGPGVRLRVDANGAWSVPEAIRALRQLSEFELECCEEPTHGVDAIAEVAAAMPSVPIALDESGSDPGVFDRPACAAICLKIVRCGGIAGMIRDADRARGAGYEVYLASTLDGPLGIAAALHAAAVIRPDRASGLATLDRFDRPSPFSPVAGVMTPPPGHGLGDGLVGWYDAD